MSAKRERVRAFEHGHRQAHRTPMFRDCFVLPEGRYWLAGWLLGDRHGFLLRPLGETDASEADTFLSFAAWRDAMIYDHPHSEWRERSSPKGAA